MRFQASKGRANEAAYAVKSTPEHLALLEDYFGSPYPYAKLDIIAVPYMGGAMEHPGLITFSAQALLQKPEEDTLNRQRGFSVVNVHELAHRDVLVREDVSPLRGGRLVSETMPGCRVARIDVREEERRKDGDLLAEERLEHQRARRVTEEARADDARRIDDDHV